MVTCSLRTPTKTSRLHRSHNGPVSASVFHNIHRYAHYRGEQVTSKNLTLLTRGCHPPARHQQDMGNAAGQKSEVLGGNLLSAGMGEPVDVVVNGGRYWPIVGPVETGGLGGSA